MAKFSARRMKESCLRCYGEPKDTPASLIERYGSTAGFHRPLGKIIGLGTVAIPMDKISEKLLSESFNTLVVSGIGLVLFFIAITGSIIHLIIKRITMIAQHFNNADQLLIN
jgi:hypothetical protein